jgi:hypothetical protein
MAGEEFTLEFQAFVDRCQLREDVGERVGDILQLFLRIVNDVG